MSFIDGFLSSDHLAQWVVTVPCVAFDQFLQDDKESDCLIYCVYNVTMSQIHRSW